MVDRPIIRPEPVEKQWQASRVSRSFDDLVDEASNADVSGWDFSWLTGRATEQRPSWGYQRLLAARLAEVGAALDLQTGGGEVLAGIPAFPVTMVATESWPPNVELATRRLHPRGVVVVADHDQPPLPFADAAFDLVSSRHPATVWWQEIARVLRPGGSYFAQHVGPESNVELYEFFLGSQEAGSQEAGSQEAGSQDEAAAGTLHSRHPVVERAAAEQAGLTVTELRTERLRVEFFDIGAVIYFLRKVIWTVPDFTVERYRQRLRELHRRIGEDGGFVSHASRTLIEARKPAGDPAGPFREPAG